MKEILFVVASVTTCIVLVSVQAEYSNCVNKLEKDLVSNNQSQFEKLFKAEAPTWETHGNLMVIMWFM